MTTRLLVWSTFHDRYAGLAYVLETLLGECQQRNESKATKENIRESENINGVGLRALCVDVRKRLGTIGRFRVGRVSSAEAHFYTLYTP